MKIHTPSALLGAILVSIIGITTAFQVQVQPISCGLTAGQKAILDLLSVQDVDNCGTPRKTLVLTGANFQIINGLGSTESTNGLGNLIVGYNEPTGPLCDDSGSHNLLLGRGSAYPSYGGLNVGIDNQLLGQHVVAHGVRQYISGSWASVLGGTDNTIIANEAAIVGGSFNAVNQDTGVAVGGSDNLVNASQSVVVGGQFNTTTGTHAVLSGGQSRTASGTHDWVAGTLFEDN